MKAKDVFILHTTIFALFSEDFSFHYVIDIKLFYLVLLFNALLFINDKRIYFPKNIIYLIVFFLIHGLFGSIVFNFSYSAVIAQVSGIAITSSYFYIFLKEYGYKYPFLLYTKYAFYIALLAIPMFYLRINVFTDGSRLNGILTEPAHYAAIMLPATYFYYKRKRFLIVILIGTTILLSKSTVGYIGLLLIFITSMVRIKYFLRYALIFGVILTGVFYYLKSNWNTSIQSEEKNVFVRRARQTIESANAIVDGRFPDYVNLSTYALLSNTYISLQGFLHFPIGSGIGSYPYRYDNYYPELSPPPYLIKLNQSQINRQDANSLFLRMLVDLGFFSFVLLFLFLRRGINIFRENKNPIAMATFFYLIVKLLREGHYFPPEFYFFLLLFFKDLDEDFAHNGRLLQK
ncbi:hypothetical protein [Aegicerativicinus sediminis]|uniref:hypothetical protein n=1 Tax=Aegicerativicinus sediminis TaxID=2893202 RepID=UPI001E4C1684|nr:hypothetical protein [Aegicerativicinus sediminis]